MSTNGRKRILDELPHELAVCRLLAEIEQAKALTAKARQEAEYAKIRRYLAWPKLLSSLPVEGLFGAASVIFKKSA